MNTEKKNMISIYPVNKWVNLWVIKRGTRDFSWEMSIKAPEDSLSITPDQMMALTESGLSAGAKAMFFFLFHHRFSVTRVCLYGQTTIAKIFGCSNKTARKDLRELESANIIKSMKIYTGRHLSYQYYITDYEEWILPKKGGFKGNIEPPLRVLYLPTASGEKLPTN